MAKSTTAGIGHMLLTLASVCIGAPCVSAAASETATVEIQLGARAGLPDEAVALAVRTVDSLLSASGIDALWRDCRAPERCDVSGDTVLLVQLLPVSKATDGETCGETVRDARSGQPTVLVFVPRLVTLTHWMRLRPAARSNPALATLEAGHLVGLTVAHELGHALGLAHAPSGVMKARPSVDDVIALRGARLTFGASEAARMRAATAAPGTTMAARNDPRVEAIKTTQGIVLASRFETARAQAAPTAVARDVIRR